MFVSGKVATQEINVSADTLRRWADTGKVRCKRINGNGKRFYHIDDVKYMFCSDRPTNSDEKTKIAYARVSSAKQQEDLQRQIDALKREYPNHKIVSDIGSGLNWKRKGLQTILEQSLQGMVSEVVVMYKDRLCRFGFELVEFIFRQTGTKMLVHCKSDDDNKTTEQELAEDLLSIVTVFAARSHGKRKYKSRKEAGSCKRSKKDHNEEDQNVSIGERQEDDKKMDGCSSLDL